MPRKPGLNVIGATPRSATSKAAVLAQKMRTNLKKNKNQTKTKEVVAYKASGAPSRSVPTKGPPVSARVKNVNAAAAGGDVVAKKPHRFRPGTVAYRNAVRLQHEYKGRIISLKQYRRLLTAHVMDYHDDGIKWQKRAVLVSQNMIEWMTINRAKLATLLASHCKHTKVGRADFELSNYILGEFCAGR